ncbi:hypothetical protein EDB83DRAFT_2398055 [Lactarius deliciosus]|nr:hypothetical protein EDB83DRAFT_2398055 [Lactarius deliciosus]
MTDMMVKIMVEVLDILGTATKEMKQSRFKKFLKKAAGMTKLEDGLKKLDKMTNDEARMASAELLRIAHDIDKKVEGVDSKLQGVGIQVKEIDENVLGVSKDVLGVSLQVQDVDENVRIVKETMQMVLDDGKEATAGVKLAMRQIAYNIDDANRRQLRESLRRWQSPSDPSTNHNIACSLQHEGSAEWFCDGNIFEEWMVAGSLLWIHGKRTLFLPLVALVV